MPSNQIWRDLARLHTQVRVDGSNTVHLAKGTICGITKNGRFVLISSNHGKGSAATSVLDAAGGPLLDADQAVPVIVRVLAEVARGGG